MSEISDWIRSFFPPHLDSVTNARDERFVEEQHYEWFKDYSHFRHLVLEHIKPTDKVLTSIPLSLSLDVMWKTFERFETLRYSGMATGARGWSRILQVERRHLQRWHSGHYVHWLVEGRRGAHAGAVWCFARSSNYSLFCCWISPLWSSFMG